MFRNFDLPKELTEFSYLAEDVNILVGENGSGKSIMLNELARHHTNAGRNVIALTNSIYDKFDVKKRNFKILRNTLGKRLAKRAIANLLHIFAQDNSENKFGVLRVFDYIGFERCLGIRLKRDNMDDLKRRSNDFYNDHPRKHLSYNVEDSFMNYFNNVFSDYRGKKLDDYLIFTLDENSYEGQFAWIFLKKFLNSHFKLVDSVKRLDFSLMKGGDLMEVLEASSGELALFTSLIFISANIDRETVILIDEPENSLHPKWQIEYIRKVLDLFYLYQPKIIIATHSPLIINGGKLNVENINILKGGPNGFFPLERNKKNVEEIYEEYFNVTTPENRYLSDFVMNKFNLLTEHKMELSDFENVVNRFIYQSYDEVQQKALRGIIKLAHQVKSNN